MNNTHISNQHKKELPNQVMNAKTAFKNGENPDMGAIRPFILNSWQRCRDYGVSSARLTAVSGQELEDALARNRDLLESSVPIMERIYANITASHSVIGLSDNTGLILHVIGKKADIDELRVVRKGYYATERLCGTNGIGTGLVEKKPIEIWGPEHYLDEGANWTCCSAPIHNDGNFAGILNISVKIKNRNLHTISLVDTAAYAISEQLHLRMLVNEQSAMFGFLDEGILIIDENRRIRSISAKAASMLRQNGVPPGAPLDSIIISSRDLDAMLAARKNIYDREITINVKSGSLQFGASCSPIPGDGTLLVLRNIRRMREYATNMLNSGAVYTFENIMGDSPAICEALELARHAARSDITTLISGESGTGKELFAQSIHNAGNRRHKPFVAVNCGAIPRSLLESELFGYEEGAFTGARKQGKPGKFELADGGTVFLDEIGELPMDAQASLLRLLQESEVVRIGGTKARHINIRVLAATNRDLEEEVRQRNFRQDLYYRLNVLSIVVPPLRERSTDIRLLAGAMLDRFARGLGRYGAEFTEDAYRALAAYNWPGNVRELENVVERTVNVAKTLTIGEEDLPPKILGCRHAVANGESSGNNVLKSREMETIKSMLAQTRGNMRLTAEKLGITRCLLYRRLRQAGLKPDMWRDGVCAKNLM